MCLNQGFFPLLLCQTFITCLQAPYVTLNEDLTDYIRYNSKGTSRIFTS